MRRIVLVPDPARVGREPGGVCVIFEGGGFRERGREVTRVELRLYREGGGAGPGGHPLITSVVYTDAGSVEMVYGEGFRGDDPLGREARFLSDNLGVSGVILRSVVALDGELRGGGT